MNGDPSSLGILPSTNLRACLVVLSPVHKVTQPRAVSLDRVTQQYARAATSIGTDQLWAALRQWSATMLTGKEGL